MKIGKMIGLIEKDIVLIGTGGPEDRKNKIESKDSVSPLTILGFPCQQYKIWEFRDVTSFPFI